MWSRSPREGIGGANAVATFHMGCRAPPGGGRTYTGLGRNVPAISGVSRYWMLRLRSVLGVVFVCVAALAGCDGAPSPAASGAPEAARPRGPHRRRADAPRIVCLGDSLTAGLGLPAEENFPSILQVRVDEAGLPHTVVNAGVSGDTSAGGRRRLDWSLDGDTRVLILALGANDGLRGLPPADLHRNLAAVIERAGERGVAVVLAGMEAPPNNGPEYTAAFRQVYRDLAADYEVAFIPFLLEGVAGHPALNQPDGIHPNAQGAAIVARTVWRALEPLLIATSESR